MFPPATRLRRPDGGAAEPTGPTVARWAAYGLMLAAGLALVGLVPAADDSASTPTAHHHTVQTTRVPASVWWVPTLQQLSAPQLPRSQGGAHQHMSIAPEPADGMHIRLTPRQLSLGKW